MGVEVDNDMRRAAKYNASKCGSMAGSKRSASVGCALNVMSFGNVPVLALGPCTLKLTARIANSLPHFYITQELASRRSLNCLFSPNSRPLVQGCPGY